MICLKGVVSDKHAGLSVRALPMSPFPSRWVEAYELMMSGKLGLNVDVQ